jgi:hypothetical protein
VANLGFVDPLGIKRGQFLGDRGHPSLGVPNSVVGVGQAWVARTGRGGQLYQLGVIVAESGPQARTFRRQTVPLHFGLAAGLDQRFPDHGRVTADGLDLLDHKPFDFASRDGRRRTALPAPFLSPMADIIPIPATPTGGVRVAHPAIAGGTR